MGFKFKYLGVGLEISLKILVAAHFGKKLKLYACQLLLTLKIKTFFRSHDLIIKDYVKYKTVEFCQVLGFTLS